MNIWCFDPSCGTISRRQSHSSNHQKKAYAFIENYLFIRERNRESKRKRRGIKTILGRLHRPMHQNSNTENGFATWRRHASSIDAEAKNQKTSAHILRIWYRLLALPILPHYSCYKILKCGIIGVIDSNYLILSISEASLALDFSITFTQSTYFFVQSLRITL